MAILKGFRKKKPLSAKDTRIPDNLIKDNSQSADWPERLVVSVEDTPNTVDEYQHAVYVTLDCGHHFLRTFEDESPVKAPKVGDMKRCRTCYMLDEDLDDGPLPPNERIH